MLLPEEDREFILGDFAESFAGTAARQDLRRACTYYWIQLFASIPWLFELSLNRYFQRSFSMYENWLPVKKSSFWLGLAALLPALLIVVPGLLQSLLGITAPNDALDYFLKQYQYLGLVIHPVLVLGGLLLAGMLNLPPALELHWQRQPEGLAGMLTLKPGFLHWALVLASLLLLTVILGYAFVENFQVVAR